MPAGSATAAAASVVRSGAAAAAGWLGAWVVKAMEEAGVKGDVDTQSIGVFRYAKGLKDGGVRQCVVSVYPLEVLIQMGAWPEAHQRERRWMSLSEAADLVHEPDLAALIRDFDATPLED